MVERLKSHPLMNVPDDGSLQLEKAHQEFKKDLNKKRLDDYFDNPQARKYDLLNFFDFYGKKFRLNHIEARDGQSALHRKKAKYQAAAAFLSGHAKEKETIIMQSYVPNETHLSGCATCN